MRARSAGFPFIPAILSSLLGLTGCAEEWGAESYRTARVSGRIQQSGEPITKGWLEIMPVDGTIGRLRSIPIGEDGRFEDDHVPVGLVAIRLVGAPLRTTDFAIFGQISLIRRSISENEHNDLEIELEIERAKLAAGLAS